MADVLTSLQPHLADRYRIERELGRGGMGTVYLAADLKHHRRVAIKVLEPELAVALGRERFLREIEISAGLTHPHILPVFDSGAADGILYYVMPYVEGESLQARLAREKQLSLDDALWIAREVADALAFAHGHGVVHRDIKPGNILLEGAHAVVADFGLARAIAAAGVDPASPTGAGTLTASGMALGTPAYMSPEQAAGAKDVDGRSDQYALGCVLYEMLAGQPPFTGPTVESLVHQHLSVTPRPVTDLRPAVPAVVRDALAKALAKTPADRFATTTEFAAALAARARTRRMRWVAPAAAICIVVTALAVAASQRWGPFAGWLGGASGAHPPRREWILVAEFEGPSGDSILATAARSLVSAALDQSEILATVPRDQIQLALQQAGKPANTRVSAEVARELAYRRAVRGVLEGEIERIGQAYSVVLRVVDAESLKVVVTERGSAKNEDALIPALGRLAERLRHDLGERRQAIAATRPMSAVATSSFEAYRLFVRAGRLFGGADYVGAIGLYREALGLDQDFAMAWFNLGLARWNRAQPDSAMAAFEQASRLPERMSLSQRLGLEAMLAAMVEEPERALTANTLCLRLNPANLSALNSSAILHEQMGRFGEALENYLEAERQSPFGASSILLSNKVECLLSLGRVNEARELARRLWGARAPGVRTEVELAACNWPSAESLATTETQLSTAGVSHFNRLAQAQAGRGKLRAAAATLAQSARVAQELSQPLHQVNVGRALLFLAGEAQGAMALPPDSWARDSSTASLLFRGLRAVAAGDEADAAQLLRAVRERPARVTRGQGESRALLEARVAALGGRWEEVVRILQPIAARSYEADWYTALGYVSGLPEARCLLADGFERIGQPDSAAAYLERMTTDAPAWCYWGGIAQPLARRRLILLYARLGRAADAERHLAVLERWWDRPDDIARRMLEEAREAVRRLQ